MQHDDFVLDASIKALKFNFSLLSLSCTFNYGFIVLRGKFLAIACSQSDIIPVTNAARSLVDYKHIS